MDRFDNVRLGLFGICCAALGLVGFTGGSCGDAVDRAPAKNSGQAVVIEGEEACSARTEDTCEADGACTAVYTWPEDEVACLCVPCDRDEAAEGCDCDCPVLEPVFVGCRDRTCEDAAVCRIWCEFGYVLDEAGCPTCGCNPGPDAGASEVPDDECASDADCGPGSRCETFGTCLSLDCPPPPPARCVPDDAGAHARTCDDVAVCDVWCEFGNVLDEAGCPTCNCNPGPDAGA